MKKAAVIICVVAVLGLAIYFGIGLIQSSNEPNEEDEIVVACAEAALWHFSYTIIPEWGYVSPEDSHQAFLIDLALEDIFLYEDHHPFMDNEKAWLKLNGYSNYIEFKADYYRDMFGWGDLPPEEIIEGAEEFYQLGILG